ncbi:hypothetical protein OJ252_2909 [Cryptosporidium canis]|uniref:Cleavage/polyadenylation specificity factor A subunit C-terminal domain-containing protein n=1 Tax=Cryptosporidium canis TaxID=195482 RepID=A0ABQ8P3W2_9CRYT|nr:hypothetical protein OJ252_2909 [Cryptosporidium canis]
MDPNNCSMLGDALYKDSQVLKTITGRFFPENRNRRFLDISTLKYNELTVFSEFLSMQNEGLSSVSYKLEDSCIDFWSYSVENSPFDLILVLDCTHSLHLFSLKRQLTPHSKLDCPLVTQRIPNTINRFPSLGGRENTNTNNNSVYSPQEAKTTGQDVYNLQFLVKKESSIQLFKDRKAPRIDFIRPYKHSKKYFSSNPIIIEKRIPKYHIAIDHETGYIAICAFSWSFLIVPNITLTKDGVIDEVKLKTQTENLFHLDSLRYKLEGISFLEACKHSKPMVCLLTDLKNHLLGTKTLIFDWTSLLKTQTNPKDNHHKPISETDFSPIQNFKSTLTTSELYHMRIFSISIPVIHMKSAHVSVGRSGNDMQMPVCACGHRKLLIIFSYERNELKLLLRDLSVAGIDRQEEEDVQVVDLWNYYDERIYIDLSDLVVIEENVENSRIKFLVSSKCMEMFVLTVQFVENRMRAFDITRIRQQSSPNFELSDISSICPYIYLDEGSNVVRSALVGSTFGIFKKIHLPDWSQEFISAPMTAQILKVEKCIQIPQRSEKQLVLAAKRYSCYWDEIKRGYHFQYDYIIRFMFLHSIRISTLIQFPTKSSGVLGISVLPIGESRHLVVYSRLGESQADLLLRQDATSSDKCEFKKVKIDGILIGEQTTILCVKICHDLLIQVSESRILLYQGVFDQINRLEAQGHKDGGFQTNKRDLWNYPDSIMFAKIVDENNILILTQGHQLIQLTVNSFDSFYSTLVKEIDSILVISSFESKALTINGAGQVILAMIGDCQGQIFAIMWLTENPSESYSSLLNLDGSVVTEQKSESIDSGMVTSMEFDSVHQNTAYIVTSRGQLYILDLTRIAQDLLGGQIRDHPDYYNRMLIDLRSYHSFDEILDWRFIGIYRKYHLSGHQICKNRIILGSTSLYLCVELLETCKEVRKVLQIRRLQLPQCSIITQLGENSQEESVCLFCLELGSAQRAQILKVELSKHQIYDKTLPLEGIHNQIESMIYLEEKSRLVVNMESTISCDRSTGAAVRSQLFLLDSEAQLYGSQTYSGDQNGSNSPEMLRFRIFPGNEKTNFFQVFNLKENPSHIQSTIIQLVSVLGKPLEANNPRHDPFFVLGRHSLWGTESVLVYKSPHLPRKYLFFFVGSQLDADQTAGLVSTLALTCVETSRSQSEPKSSITHPQPPMASFFGQTISFGTDLVLKIEHSVSFPGKLIESIASLGDAKSIQLDLVEPISDSSTQFILHRMFSKLGTEFKLNMVEYGESPLKSYPHHFQVYESHSDHLSLIYSGKPLKHADKIFIIGMQILLNYMFKRPNNEIVSAFPAVFTNLLFSIFDTVFSTKFRAGLSKSSCNTAEERPFFAKKRAVCLTDKQINDGLGKTTVCLHQVSDLYRQTCPSCTQWKVLMVLVIWYNLITRLIDCRDTQHVFVRNLTCPLIKDWILELEKNVCIDSQLIMDQSYIFENFLVPDSYHKYFQELVFYSL